MTLRMNKASRARLFLISLLKIAVLLKPSLDVFRIAFDPSGLRTDGVTALGERLVVATSVLVGEELFNVGNLVLVCEA